MNAMRAKPFLFRRSSWARTASLGLVVALTFLLTGDRGRTAVDTGIDPIEILNLQVRHNVIVLLDSSGSMRQRPVATSNDYVNPGPNAANAAVVGDDPDSKMAQAKTVIRTIVNNNQTKVNFMFGRYTQTQTQSALGPETSPTFLYKVSCAATASTCQTRANAISITAFGAANLRRSQTSDIFTEADGSKTYYLEANTFFNGVQVNALSTGACNGTCTQAGAGKANPAPVTVKVGNGTAVTFYFQGVRWNVGNDNGSCTGFKVLMPLQACTATDQLTPVNPYLRKEVVTAVSGANIGDILNPDGTVWNGLRTSLYAVDGGIRASGYTPIANSLDYIKTVFDSGDATATPPVPAIWPNRPNAAQRTFVIVVTDGDDLCGGYLQAAHSAQNLYNGSATDVTQKVETFVVVFGGGASPNQANQISYGGSGMPPSPNGPPLSGSAWSRDANATEVANCTTCRGAFTASNTSDLEAAIQAAIDQGANSGEFSDQQSITDSVFEYGSLVSPQPSPPIDPLDPQTRYTATIPVLLQSTFEMPGFVGHLNAFRNDGALAVQLWDAGDKLCQRVTGYPATTTGSPAHCDTLAPAPWPLPGPNMGTGTTFVFTDLSGSGSFASARIQRHIYSATQNGVNPGYTPQNLVDSSATLAWQRVPLWPPDSTVDPSPASAPYPSGALDTALGIAAMTPATLASLGACAVTSGGTLDARCASSGFIQKEAREIILAFTAGAQVVVGADGKPARTVAGDLRGVGLLQFKARPWFLAESTLASPGLVTPPIPASPTVHDRPEYVLYRDGPRDAAKHAVNGIASGFGLRNPDDDGQATSKADTALKPVMSVVYHATNHMLHAFRAGRCPSGVPSCSGETGGEELWAFVPFDQLGKLVLRMKTQGRQNHTFVLAAPVRFADVFVPGAFTKAIGGASTSGSGVWRTLLYVGRGVAGRYITSLDVTVPGAFTTAAVNTSPPIVVWSRGNPDTQDGTAGGAKNNTSSNPAGTFDYNAYLKMGETWSVPAVGYVTAANNTTRRKPRDGVEFVAWVGSGFSDVSTEGTTFYALDALNGDVIASHTVADGSSAAGIRNSLVASPSGFAAAALSARSYVNPATEKITSLYFPDLHSRVWRFLPDSPSSPPTVFTDVSADGDQPIANAAALINLNTDGSGPKPHVFFEAGNDSRVPRPGQSAVFRMYALRDNSGTSAAVFPPIDFPAGYRGTVQPALAFNADISGQYARVFYGGTKFNPAGDDCISSFDSVIFALQAATGNAAYDLSSGGDDRYVTMDHQRINAIRVTGGQLVVDTGLQAQNPPPPPGPIVVGPPVPSAQSNVTVGSKVAGTIPFKAGSSVCR